VQKNRQQHAIINAILNMYLMGRYLDVGNRYGTLTLEKQATTNKLALPQHLGEKKQFAGTHTSTRATRAGSTRKKKIGIVSSNEAKLNTARNIDVQFAHRHQFA
jgi:hypothetical protein